MARSESAYPLTVTVPFQVMNEAECKEFLKGMNSKPGDRELTTIATDLMGKKVWLSPVVAEWAMKQPGWKGRK
ncbi:MAG: hypothetical protein ABF966_06230 [Bifidobacterium psychraerophilum]|uniref:hypothetical protein n=1 Tax=Bifidobacterium psychraerophilum TaxID=218140 RepID=UPI0039EC425F